LYWARFSEGRLGEALSWAALDTQEKSPRAYEIKKELVDRLCRFELADALDTAAWMSQAAKNLAAAWIQQYPQLSAKDLTRRTQKGLIQMVIALLSDVAGYQLGKQSYLVNSDQILSVQKLSSVYDSRQIAEKILVLQNLLGWVDDNVNEKLIFEQVLFKLSFSDILIDSLV
jgi:hypothetical protein